MFKLLLIALAGMAVAVNSSISLGQSPDNAKVGIPSPSLSVLALRTAQIKNLFREEVLEASLIQLATNVTITALTTKEVDYATASVAAMRSAISGLPVKTVMFVMGRPLHVLVARPEILLLRSYAERSSASALITISPTSFYVLFLRAITSTEKRTSRTSLLPEAGHG
jgi:hypothetical protein